MEADLETQVPEMYCIDNNFAGIFCCNSTCQACALICLNPTCKCLKSSHSECKFCNIDHLMSQIDAQKKAINPNVWKTAKLLTKVYDDLIEYISEQRESIRLW